MVRNKRRQFFIKSEFQGKYIFKAFISVVFGSILFVLIFSFFSSNTLSIAYDNYHLTLGMTPRLLLNKILSTQWLFIVSCGMAVAVITLFLSHRVAGPFFRFEKALDLMTTKDISSRVYLRKKDEGKALGEKINLFNEMLSQSLQRMRQTSERIKICCDGIQSAGDGQVPSDLLKKQLEEIKRCNHDNLELLSEFKLMVD